MNWTPQSSWPCRLASVVLLLFAVSGAWKLVGQNSETLTLDLGTLPGGDFSRANDINSRGQIVGESSTATTSNHAFLFTDGAMIDLGVLPGVSNPFAGSSASAINDRGQVVGYSSASNNGPVHAFLFSDGLMRDLGTLGGIFSFGDSVATDINEEGHVVGYASEPDTLPSEPDTQRVMRFCLMEVRCTISGHSPVDGRATPVPSIILERSLDTLTLPRATNMLSFSATE